MEKDYSLLRPFDLEAAKRGEKICNGNETILRFTAGPHIKNNGVVTENEFGFYTIHKDSLFMLPLAWVEGKPVYKGDALWHTKRRCTVTVDRADELGHIHESDNSGWDFIHNLTWQKPKTKRDGWVNIYRFNCTALFADKETADKNAVSGRIDCIRIEWDE